MATLVPEYAKLLIVPLNKVGEVAPLIVKPVIVGSGIWTGASGVPLQAASGLEASISPAAQVLTIERIFVGIRALPLLSTSSHV